MQGLIEPESEFTFIIEKQDVGARVDIFIAQKFPLYSRSFFQHLIEHGHVLINGRPISKGGVRLKEGDRIEINFPPPPDKEVIAEKIKNITVPIIYKHPHFLIINKPAGLVVHHSHTQSQPTLVDWIVNNFQEIKLVGAVDRPGIVHRLDKDTSGLMIIARTNYGQTVLSDLFKQRKINKTYWALVQGAPPAQGTINLPVCRHSVHRHKMIAHKTMQAGAREAITHYHVLRYFSEYALVEAKPVTGRTHQIRVHFAAIGHPLVGDALYGKPSGLIPRHALHAHQLQFNFDDQEYSFISPVPDDFAHALEQVTPLK